MANRDKVVRKLKSQIDKLNTQAAQLERRAKKAQAGYAKQARQFRAKRDAALARVQRLRGASAGAFKDLARGASSALKNMRSAFGRARRQFSTVK